MQPAIFYLKLAPHMPTIIGHINDLKKLNQQFLKYLPKSLSPHCHLANIDEKHLIFHVDSPVWVAVLRHQTPLIIEIAKNKLGLSPNISLILKVHPKQPFSTEQKYSPLIISNKSSKLLMQTANQIKNKKLKTALKKLAKPR